MKEAIDVVKRDLKAKLLLWDNIKNPKFKVVLVLLFIALVSLKIFTTVLTFDWLASLFK
jgi:hypothetical protein